MIPHLPNNFLGKSGFVWWVGVIETRADPLGLGRCQVRIFGFHGDFTDENSTSRIDIPTEDLPWAMPLYPLNNSKSFSAPRIGEWVVGFFFDGESAQFPVMMGVLPGYNTEGQNTQTQEQTEQDTARTPTPGFAGVPSQVPAPVEATQGGDISVQNT